MKEKILITSALPYANGQLHFGHIAGVYLPADCFTRFQRLKKNDVLHICGSDEYGIAITLSADLAGRSPKEHVDIFHALNSELFQKLNISFDHFSRTTWSGHKEPVQRFFIDLLNNGYIEERVTDQLYSEKDRKFLADRYVVGTCPKCGFQNARGDECPECGASYEATDLKNPRSKLTGASLIHKSTKHWFLLLDKFKDKLNSWLETKKWKPNVLNFIKGYIADLHARAITRDSTWGIPIPLPNSEGKCLYVWFDAPIGYISFTMEWAQLKGQPDRWKDYWLDPQTRFINFMGKDNIPFHAAIFPAMIMGQNLPYKLVDELPANEFYKLEGRQFSKSEGWYIDLSEFLKRYSSDQIRYMLAATAPETADSEFTWKEFQQRCNGDLLGKYGNLVNRILVFAHQHCDGKVPSNDALEPIDTEFLAAVRKLTEQASEHYGNFKLRAATQTIMELAQLGNAYFDKKKPWLTAKEEASRPSMRRTIASCLECLKALALISFPVIPETANKVWKLLGYTNSLQEVEWQSTINRSIPPEQKLAKPEILFQRIEDQQIEEEIKKLHQMSKQIKEPKVEQTQQFIPLKPEITIDDIRKVDLRVAQIISAVAVPKSKKLLQLEVDLGFEKRTIVAGISQSYQPDQLIGKKIVVVANLKPATLMGVESHGMVLVGSLEQSLEIVSLQQLPPGSVVS